MAALFFGALFGLAMILFGYKLFFGSQPWVRGKEKLGLTSRPLVTEKATPRQLQIEPLKSFDWEKMAPLKFRPFKPIYFITMALQSNAPSDLIIIDSNYKDRVLERRDTMRIHESTVMGATPPGCDAVQELYSFLVGDYLPARYPTMFTLSENSGTMLNHVTKKAVPTRPPGDPLASFRLLGETVEDDMFLLQETSDGHRLVAFLCCFPSGFDPSSKLGKVLKDIHEPVPSYEKIGPSMERLFSRLEVGKSVKRVNWSVATEPKLFTPQGHHIYREQPFEENEDVDIESSRVRIELQTLTRLPKTRAILFSFKTYLYPVADIKKEGLGPQLADAIEGLKSGNAPGMSVYKGAVRWGKSVCEYLRS
ncbi:hypothetical protein QBC33DRAFT_530410 [Phialemonium atrogriseum]|uniref:DUF3445 domain-containing protein n=1 Tax=Phialemonium atrogriseum TaxID=1093897 RepID=A0AAJ0FRJ2_9PEZI|nr:uncharacterized protein QBC33DRAFT_530410 [Phialemonium atrogriseum]KAK1770205.1 hypothetical protein QBC33DRAFT_530410 [Phialemonium atrogriseum]